MLNRDDYRRGWEWKHDWYAKNGYKDGETLFTSQDDNRGGLDWASLKKTAMAIKERL